MSIIKAYSFKPKRSRQIENTFGVRFGKTHDGSILHSLTGFEDITEICDIKNPFASDQQPGFRGGEIREITDVDVFGDKISVDMVGVKLTDEFLDPRVHFEE